MENSAPSWLENNYASGLVAGGGDTRMVISAAYDAPYVKFGGGNGSKPVWWFRIYGSSGTTYNLNSAPNGVTACGSNYVRFGDGTQICWGSCGNNSFSSFGAAFANTDYRIGMSE